LLAVAPVAGASKPEGLIYGGILLNHNRELVDQIKRLIFGADLSGGRDIGSVSLFIGDVRIATTVVREGGALAEGTRVSYAVGGTVLDHGDRWYGRAPVLNEWHLAAYEPIRDNSGRVLGMLGVGMQEKPFLAVRTDMMLTFLVVAAVGVLVVLGLTYLITRSMIHPLEEIVVASNIIAAGDLDHTVNVSARDEIGLLASSFNKMVASLKTMKLELEEWGRTLEEKVKKRTEELVTVQNQMAQSEKLASIGRLAAGVAHEINNPLGGILAFSSLALEECGENDPVRQNLEVVVKQTIRCRETVKGLLDFARQSTAAASPTEINPVIEKTLSLLQNQSIFQNIKTVLRLKEDLPQVLIDPGQLQQVVVNIALNAVDAMEETGTLTVETGVATSSEEVMIRISDTGKGIPDEILPLIFEPFFTTKKVGHGTGLGLSIVHGIVTRAGGKIEVASSSRGATFTIRLPIAREELKDGGVQAQPPSSDDHAGQPAERR
jgi:two-component system NtrC family sensor kinase